MRVWFRKIHCTSFISFFCKPPQHLCTPDTNHNHRSAAVVVVAADSDHLCIGKKEEDDKSKAKSRNELILKSSIKRKAVEGKKKTVKWMDVAGKELVQVKEFQISESEDTDCEGEYNRGCICSIL